MNKQLVFLCLLWVGVACSVPSTPMKALERAQARGIILVQAHQREILFLRCSLVAVVVIGGVAFFRLRKRQVRLFREGKAREWALRDEITRLERERDIGALNEKATGMREQLFRQLSASEMIPAPGKRKKSGKKGDAVTAADDKLKRLSGQEIDGVVKNVNDVAWSGFADRLGKAYPLLKKGEVQFCCLIRAGVTVTELSAIYNITPSAVCQRKVRIKRNKMHLHNDYRTLDDILSSFDKSSNV